MSNVPFSRTTILGCNEGEIPRTLNELNLLRALGAILDKPQWWLKWTTRHEDFDLQRYTETCLLQVCVAAGTIPEAEDRDARIRELTVAVPQLPSWHEDVIGTSGYRDPDYETVASDYGPDGFGQILWYMKMRGFHEGLRELVPAEWTREKLEALVNVVRDRDDQIAVSRATSFIVEVLRQSGCEPRQPPTIETVASVLGEPRENVVRIICHHCKEIYRYIEASKTKIVAYLQEITEALELPVDGQVADSMLCPLGVTPGPAPRTWLGDGIIPADIKATFVKQVATLENVPENAKDWHPNSNKQVLDLVHPSLYCIVKGMTKYLSQGQVDQLDFKSPVSHLQQIMTIIPSKTVEELGGSCYDDDYQWIPSEVDVGEDGTSAKFVTYINNLHPVTRASMYDTIAAIFGRFVPLFNRVLSSLQEMEASIIPKPQPTYKLDGNRCQVIVKIAEIHLTPENPQYVGGSWHIEGTGSEQIIATGLYYFGSENITESRLSFRTIVQEPEYEQNDHVGIGLKYGLANDKLLVQSLGSVTAIEDRCVVFPNLHQHKVEPFELVDSTRPGVRKILAFFLVNPSKSILSTAVVPPQQQEWMDLAQEPALKQIKLPGGVEETVRDMLREGMTLEDAKEHRLDIMSHRVSPGEDVDADDLYFSLCGGGVNDLHVK